MSSTIKTNQLKRALTQHTAQKKSELNNKHLNDLKNLKTSIKQSHADAQALARTTPAVNHIKTRSTEQLEKRNPDQTRLYTRQARMNNDSESVDSDDTDIAEERRALAEERAEEIAARAEEKNENKEAVAEELAMREEDRANEKLELQENKDLAREEDEFYHVQNRGNTISEDESGYYIDAYAPEHEKAGVKVSVTSNKAVISGSRKAANEAETENSRVSTHNFQSFREEFDFGTPVISQGITRERNGDFIRFFIPKMNGPVEASDTTNPKLTSVNSSKSEET